MRASDNNKAEINGTCTMHEEDEKCFQILTGNPKAKRSPVGRSQRGEEY
jgi:hypothetical protein